MELDLLKDLVVIFTVAMLVVIVLRRLRVPEIAGFIVAGILVGPHGLKLVSDAHQVETLAEIGVVLLLFGIGLELSLDRLRRLWRAILLGGAVQVGLSVAAVAAIARAMGLPAGSAVFLGCMVAVSSTAIVLRGLATRGELDTPHGRLALGILVFQDLGVVPMILVIPLLSGAESGAGSALRGLMVGLGLLAVVLVGARLVVPRLLDLVARTRRRDLFVLAVFLICFGIAWAAAGAGISLALGAFLGGLVVASSEYRHQALSDLVPLREVLTSIFFVSVGMLLDTVQLLAEAGPVLGLLVAILLGKFLLVFLTAASLRLPLRVCILTGATLAQVGEFSFVLLRAAGGTGLVPESLDDPLLGAIVLSMAVTPVALAVGPRLATGAGRATWLDRLLKARAPEEAGADPSLANHAVVAGYGLTGQQLARALRSAGKPCVVVDLNPDNVRRALADGVNACYGDLTSVEVLEKLQIERARLLVVAVNDPDAALRGIRAARSAAPELRIFARTPYATDAHRLRSAGADVVVAAEVEAAAGIGLHVLREFGLPAEDFGAQFERLRADAEALATGRVAPPSGGGSR